MHRGEASASAWETGQQGTLSSSKVVYVLHCAAAAETGQQGISDCHNLVWDMTVPSIHLTTKALECLYSTVARRCTVPAMLWQARTGVLCEIQSVLSALRRNVRFATVSKSAGIGEV